VNANNGDDYDDADGRVLIIVVHNRAQAGSYATANATVTMNGTDGVETKLTFGKPTHGALTIESFDLR
jgi:hypothetical protein